MGWLLPPTDNLHKFCAILGLILMVGPMAGLIYLVDYASELTDIATLGGAKTDVELLFVADTETLQQLQKKIMEAQFDKLLRPEDIPAFLSIDTLDKRIEERKEQLKAIGMSIAENKSANAKAQRFIKYSKGALFCVLAFIFVGGRLALFGFKGWAQLSEHEKARLRQG